MKLNSVISILLSCTIFVLACKKSNNNPDPVYQRGMHAKINGVSWTATYVTKTTINKTGGNFFEIDGWDTVTNEMLSFEIPQSKERRAYTISVVSGNNTATAFYGTFDSGATMEWGATSGRVNITSINDSAFGGTFNFVAESKTITEGTFNVNF